MTFRGASIIQSGSSLCAVLRSAHSGVPPTRRKRQKGEQRTGPIGPRPEKDTNESTPNTTALARPRLGLSFPHQKGRASPRQRGGQRKRSAARHTTCAPQPPREAGQSASLLSRSQQKQVQVLPGTRAQLTGAADQVPARIRIADIRRKTRKKSPPLPLPAPPTHTLDPGC